MDNFTIDYRNFLAGASSADGIEDAGYSPLYGGHNIQEEHDGYLYPAQAWEPETGFAVDPVGLTDAPILYVKSPLYGATPESVFGVVLDTDGDVMGHESINTFDFGTSIDSATSAMDTLGQENGISYRTDIYIASAEDVSLVPIDDYGTVGLADDDWWSVTRGHGQFAPTEKSILVVVEDTLYIINKNEIHTWDGTTSVEDALTLPPDFYATAALKHTNGRDLIVFGTVKDDPSETAGAGFRVYYINLVDLEFTDEIEITREVQGCWNVGGTIYATCNEWLCLFDGSDVSPLRKLGVTIGDSPANDLREGQIWTHHGCKTDYGVLMLPDGNKILAIGDNGLGNMMWHVFDGTAYNIDVIHLVFNIGNKYIGFWGYDGARWTGTLTGGVLELQEHDGAGYWAANKYRFNQKAWVRKITIDHETLATGDDFRVGYIKEDGTLQELRAITYTKYGAKNQTRVDCNVYGDIFQPYIQWVAGGVGIKKITVFYENGE